MSSEEEKAGPDQPVPSNGGKKKTKPCTPTLTESLDEQLRALPEGSQVAVFAHRTPDPDAISSMMAMRWFLYKNYGLESKLFYDGSVGHPQNSVMCNLLDPGMVPVEEYKAEEFQYHILVDTIPENAGVGTHKIDFKLVVDHHRELPHDYNGILIHMKVGSAAAIVFTIIDDLLPKDNWFDDDTDNDTKVATAMIAGIMTDTNYLLSSDTTEVDLKAFSELSKYRHVDYLHQIVFFKRPKFWIDKKAMACSEATIDGEGYAVVGLGVIPSKERDLIADMAEEMVQWASVETAVAFAVVGGDRIEGSIRSNNASLSVPDFCKKLGGKTGGGGGKHGKGAYRIPLSPEIDIDDTDEELLEVWESIKKREDKRIQKIIRK